jgi:dienelactone hydrolase
MTNHAPGTTEPGSAQGFGDALRRAAERDAGTVEIEHMARGRFRAFAASEFRRALAGAGALVASAGRSLAAATRQWRHAGPALLLCLAFGATPAKAEQQAAAIMLVAVGEGAYGVMSVPMHTDTLGGPAVVIVDDALGRDSRAERYVEQLLALGFTVLEIEPFPDKITGAATLPHVDDLEAARRVTEAAEALGSVAGINPHAIGALGFGAGARAVLLAPPRADGREPFLARVLLYPGCATLRRGIQGSDAAPRGQVLLLHGGHDPGNTQAACALLATDLAAGGEVRHVVMPQAGYAWDYVPAGAVAGPTLLPTPAGRVTADPWPDATSFAADTVSMFLARALYGAMAAAPASAR